MAQVRRRRGAREAKKAERAAPVSEDIRAVRPGLPGGRFAPLAPADVERVNDAVMEVLATIGLSGAIPSCVERVVAAGGSVNDEGRLLFPRALVEDTIANCRKELVLYGQDPKHDMEISGSKVYFGTAGAAVHIADVQNNDYRESLLRDVYDIARLVDTLDNIHYFQRPVTARDMVEPVDLDVNTCYAAVSGTTKHVGSSWVEPEHVTASLQMLHKIAGGEDKWRERPFVSMSNCFVVPPLRFAEDACRCLEVAVEGGMPVLLLSAGQAGATSPASVLGSVVQATAEVLAGAVYVNLIRPGAPFIFGTWPFVSDLRTGAMSGGSGEQAILAAAVGQMGRFYGMPCGTAAGMTDAKMPDAQSGFEKGYTVSLAAHSGVNLVYESAGMHGSLMGACYESYVIDNDMLGAINRTVRGLEVTEEALSIQTIKDVTSGPQHFLGHGQTMHLMQREYLYPEIADRTSPKEWAERGKPVLLDQATARVEQVLGNHFPSHIDEAMDQAIRAELDIKLPREQMRPNAETAA